MESLGNIGHQHTSIALKTVPLLDGLPSSNAEQHNEHRLKTVRQLWESLGNIGHQHVSVARKTVSLHDGHPSCSAERHNEHQFKIRWATMESLGNIGFRLPLRVAHERLQLVRQRWETLGNNGHQHASVVMKTVPLLDDLPSSSAQLHNDCRFKNFRQL
jgi:hypothetical protein